MALSSLQEEQFDPIKGSADNTKSFLGPMMDFLITMKGADLAPGALDKWEMAPNGLSWTYYIHKGVKFHNGDDLTAADVKFTLDRFSSSQATYVDLKNAVDRVDIVDDYTVRISTKGTQIYLPFLNSQFSPALGVVLPKAYIEQKGINYFQLHPIGSGPFRFVSYVPGDSVQYEALDKHWRRTAEFKKLTLLKMPEGSTRVAALKTGGVDVIEISLENVPDLQAANIRSIDLDYVRPGVNIVGAYSPAGATLPTADIRVREALSLAINREELNKNLFYGRLKPAPPPMMWSNMADLDNAYWLKYSANIYRYDPARATELLKQAGYSQGFTIKLYSSSQIGGSFLPDMAQVIQGYWSKIGVKAQIVPIDWSTFKQYRNALKSPVAIGAAYVDIAGGPPYPPRNLVLTFHSGGNVALAGTAMPQLDKLIDASWIEVDNGKRKEILAQATKMATDAYVVLVIGESPSVAALGPLVDIVMPAQSPNFAMYSELFTHRAPGK